MGQDFRLTRAYEQMLKGNQTLQSSSPRSLTEAYSKVSPKISEITHNQNFINEAILRDATPQSLPLYYANINSLLQTSPPTPLDVKIKNEIKIFLPNPGQSVATSFSSLLDPTTHLNDKLTGSIDGENQTILIKQIVKTNEIKGQELSNKGQIQEGLLGAAIYAKLIKRPNVAINSDDVYQVISDISKATGTTVKKLSLDVQEIATNLNDSEEENRILSIKDKFTLIVRLKQQAMISFTDVNLIKKSMSGELESTVLFVNENLEEIAKTYATNNIYDSVEVISDGVSNEASSKVDVALKLNGKEVDHFGFSVKQGGAKWLAQQGSGGERSTREAQFIILDNFFKILGITIADVKQQFESSNNLYPAYCIAYEEAKKQLSTGLQTSYDKTVDKLLEGIRILAISSDRTGDIDSSKLPKIKLLQFTAKGYYMLDFDILKEKFKQSDIKLGVTLREGKTEADSYVLPKITIYDKNSNRPFLTIRMYMRKVRLYVRNYVEQEELLTHILKTKESNHQTVKQDQLRISPKSLAESYNYVLKK